MSGQFAVTLYQKQREARPNIEEAIATLLDGEKKKHANDFIAFLKTHKMTPQWASLNAWSVKYKNKPVCSIKFYDLRLYMDKNAWRICYSGEYDKGYENLLSDENIRDIILNNVYFCRNCAGTRMPHSVHSSIFGREFDDVCLYFKIQFENPDAETMKCARKLVEMRINTISGNV